MTICRHCRKETDETKPNCEHCGQALTAGMIGFLKTRGNTDALGATTPPTQTAAPAPKPPTAPKPSTAPLKPKPRADAPTSSELPASALVYFRAEQFFRVQPSGERSIIARMFGSTLTLPALCSAMLFTAYVSNVTKHLIRLRVAAAVTTGPLTFPIHAQWVRLLSEPLGLYRDHQETLEGMIMEHLRGRGLTSDATQRMIADLIDWPHPLSQLKRAKPAPPQTWDRHYADMLTAPARRYASAAQQAPAEAVAQTEKILRQFCQQDAKVAEYLSHEVNVIVQWLSTQQDEQVRQRLRLLYPQGTNPLDLSLSNLYDDKYWNLLTSYTRREFGK